MDSAPPQPSSDDARYEAFVRLFVAHEPRVRGFLRTMLPAWEDVDDVLQEASLVAWRKFEQFDGGGGFFPWLATIARFEALKHLRRQSRDRLVFSDDVLELLADESVEDSATAEARRHALDRCLEKLSDAERELLATTSQPGARLNEIAARAGKSAQAFYKTLQRLRAALLECVERQLREEAAA